jgi:DNA-binding response OmpR family regulator
VLAIGSQWKYNSHGGGKGTRARARRGCIRLSGGLGARIGVNILIIDSDPEVEEQLQVLLEQQGHRVLVSAGVSEALSVLSAERVDLLIAECKQLELNGVPLFRLLARGTQAPLILPTLPGLASGRGAGAVRAEAERVAEAVSLVRRLLAEPQGDVLRVGDLVVDTIAKQVLIHGQPALLPPIQFRLLAYLAQNAGRVVGAQELLKAVWGYEGDETEARELVKVHVRQIRRRLGLGTQGADYVQSVRGFGYVLRVPIAHPS